MSAMLQSLHLLRPEWLWALLALPALWAMWRLRQRRGEAWRGVVDAHLLPHLIEPGGATVRRAAWLGALGYVVAVLALAGPSWRQVQQPLWQSQAPLVIALDLSSATLASDLPPSRLLQARAKLATLLRERQGGQVGLIAYAGEAFTVAPLTDDAANVALFLDSLHPEVMPVDGQHAGKAIDAAAQLMRQAGFDSGDILLLGDHAGIPDRARAAEALRQGFRVSALGLGTPAGAPYRDSGGRILKARLDADSLQALVRDGGGTYRPLSGDASDLRALGVLEPEAVEADSARGEKGMAWKDEGYWLLPLLMLLALFAFRRGGGFAILLLCLLAPLSIPVQAAETSLWKREDQQRHQRIERGADAYRRGEFEAAEKSFAGIDSATARYNLGNALAKQGRYDEAIAAYDQALRLQPGMEDAIENRKVVDAARKRQPPKGGDNDKDDKDGEDGKGGPSPKDGQQEAPSPGGGQDPQPPSDESTGTPKQDAEPRDRPQPPTAPADSQQQRAADAAQRERMEKAMAEAGKTDAPGEQPAQADTPESRQERERRQAVEAWLRRVPDDPGGLLKAKFRLEYERRQRGE